MAKTQRFQLGFKGAICNFSSRKGKENVSPDFCVHVLEQPEGGYTVKNV